MVAHGKSSVKSLWPVESAEDELVEAAADSEVDDVVDVDELAEDWAAAAAWAAVSVVLAVDVAMDSALAVVVVPPDVADCPDYTAVDEPTRKLPLES